MGMEEAGALGEGARGTHRSDWRERGAQRGHRFESARGFLRRNGAERMVAWKPTSRPDEEHFSELAPPVLAMTDPVEDDVLRAMDPQELTNLEAMKAWDAVVGDMESTASAYEAEGWRAVVCHPGDVTIRLGEDRPGVDVLLPDDEYAEIESLVETASFDEYEVLRAMNDGLVFAVVVMQDTDQQLAFLFPTYFEPEEFAPIANETVTVYLRRLQGQYVQLELEEPELFLKGDDE